MPRSRPIAAAALGLTDAAAVRMLAAPAVRTPEHVAHAREWVAASGADKAALELAQGALWLTSLWLAVALLSGVASTAPGVVGRFGSTVAGWTLPTALRALVVSSIGVSVALAPGIAGAASNAGSGSAGSTGASTGAASAGFSSSQPAVSPQSLQALASREIQPGRPGSRAIGAHARPAAAPTVRWPQNRLETSDAGVTVEPGDSLWLIAARRLGPQFGEAQIARAWPRWYRTNHRVIGDDPNLVRPGQHLYPPAEKGAIT